MLIRGLFWWKYLSCLRSGAVPFYALVKTIKKPSSYWESRSIIPPPICPKSSVHLLFAEKAISCGDWSIIYTLCRPTLLSNVTTNLRVYGNLAHVDDKYRQKFCVENCSRTAGGSDMVLTVYISSSSSYPTQASYTTYRLVTIHTSQTDTTLCHRHDWKYGRPKMLKQKGVLQFLNVRRLHRILKDARIRSNGQSGFPP